MKDASSNTQVMLPKSFYKSAKNPTVKLAEPNFIQLLL